MGSIEPMLVFVSDGGGIGICHRSGTQFICGTVQVIQFGAQKIDLPQPPVIKRLFTVFTQDASDHFSKKRCKHIFTFNPDP